MLPQARQDHLVVQELGDEVIIYDEQRNHIHRLNQSAALVWRYCNGRTSIAEMVDLLQGKLSVLVTEDVVWLALDRLEKEHLLQDRLVRPTNAEHITRRQVLRKVALVGGATLLLPVIQSMIAPTPAMAMSLGCAQVGEQPGNRPCCPGLRVVRDRCYGHGLGLP